MREVLPEKGGSVMYSGKEKAEMYLEWVYKHVVGLYGNEEQSEKFTKSLRAAAIRDEVKRVKKHFKLRAEKEKAYINEYVERLTAEKL